MNAYTWSLFQSRICTTWSIFHWRDRHVTQVSPRVRSKTPPEGYSVFLSYESSMRKTAIEHPRKSFSNATQAREKSSNMKKMPNLRLRVYQDAVPRIPAFSIKVVYHRSVMMNTEPFVTIRAQKQTIKITRESKFNSASSSFLAGDFFTWALRSLAAWNLSWWSSFVTLFWILSPPLFLSSLSLLSFPRQLP